MVRKLHLIHSPIQNCLAQEKNLTPWLRILKLAQIMGNILLQCEIMNKNVYLWWKLLVILKEYISKTIGDQCQPYLTQITLW